MSDDDDRALLAAWQRGERDAGRHLFRRYYEPVTRFFVNKAGDAAAELTQKTFLACVEGRTRYRGDGSFRSYVFAIAYRQLCRHYRDRHRDPVDFTTASACDLDPSPSRIAVEREEQRLLLAALRAIPLVYQTVFELHYWEDVTTAEIAAILEIPAGTVKSRLRLGRGLLRAAIERLAATPALAEQTWGGLDTWAHEVAIQVARDNFSPGSDPAGAPGNHAMRRPNANASDSTGEKEPDG